MSEENATYAPAEGKMRAALEAVDKWFSEHISLQDEGAEAISQIKEALAMQSPEIVPVRYHQAWGTGYQACLDDSLLEKKSVLEKSLCELPESIKLQSSTVADLTADIEKLRLSIAMSKNQSWELVLCATVTDMGKTKEKYTNEKARNLAVEQLLREDKLYLENCDALGRTECELRAEQIQFDYLHNQFKAYLAIAQMPGVR